VLRVHVFAAGHTFIVVAKSACQVIDLSSLRGVAGVCFGAVPVLHGLPRCRVTGVHNVSRALHTTVIKRATASSRRRVFAISVTCNHLHELST
jgi:hypothetical protein